MQTGNIFITIFFLFQKVDAVFDFLNTRSAFGKGSKEPIRPDNWAEKQVFLEDVKHYLLDLTTVDGQPIYKSKRYIYIYIYRYLYILSKSKNE